MKRLVPTLAVALALIGSTATANSDYFSTSYKYMIQGGVICYDLQQAPPGCFKWAQGNICSFISHGGPAIAFESLDGFGCDFPLYRP